ncbi:UTRA domain-containing protein, partial [Streptomyces sp. B15]|nr:UTRA domain-containing protein [Streptomyces sp. B15]
LAELARAQPAERGYPGGLRRRDHTRHGKIISPLTSSYGTTLRAVHRRRVTNNQSGPITLSTSWFGPDVGERAPKLRDADRIQEGTLMYVENMTGRQGSYAEDRMCARLATDDEASDLALTPGSAVLIVHHVVYDLRDRPLEFAEATYPPERWAFEQGYPLN